MNKDLGLFDAFLGVSFVICAFLLALFCVVGLGAALWRMFV